MTVRGIMTIYIYGCEFCDEEIEKNVPIDERDNQFCICGQQLLRKLKFTGSVYAPTSTDGGMK